MSEWKSVKELPKYPDNYLCLVIIPDAYGGTYHKKIEEVMYNGHKGWNISNVIITHWMPRPEDPKN